MNEKALSDLLDIIPATQREPQWQRTFLLVPQRAQGRWWWGSVERRAWLTGCAFYVDLVWEYRE